MFTGIIAALGTATALEARPDHSAILTLTAPPAVLDGLERGGSLSVSGTCLTALDRPEEGTFRAVVMGETLDRTTLGALGPGDTVNLERCTPADGRFDGHVVAGHVDGVGTVMWVEDEGSWRRVRIGLPTALAGQVAEKGSIALDGVSLTLTAVSDPGVGTPWVEVALIPETLAATTLGAAAPGTQVNVETDVIAKYVDRLLAVRAAGTGAAA